KMDPVISMASQSIIPAKGPSIIRLIITLRTITRTNIHPLAWPCTPIIFLLLCPRWIHTEHRRIRLALTPALEDHLLLTRNLRPRAGLIARRMLGPTGPR
ncbi:hypothetical protein HKX48_009194, partial [Thoreauomyces humboldtii]